MKRDIKSPIKPVRLNGLPEETRGELKEGRLKRGWSQAELGRRVSLPQMHISGIETGKIVPRYDTLLDLVRVLGYDLVMIPRSLVPAVLAIMRDYRRRDDKNDSSENDQPAYIADDIQRQKGNLRNEV